MGIGRVTGNISLSGTTSAASKRAAAKTLFVVFRRRPVRLGAEDTA